MGWEWGAGQIGWRTSPVHERAAAKESITSNGSASVLGMRMQGKPSSPWVYTVLSTVAPDAEALSRVAASSGAVAMARRPGAAEPVAAS